jgi:hypothetical protein
MGLVLAGCVAPADEAQKARQQAIYRMDHPAPAPATALPAKPAPPVLPAMVAGATQRAAIKGQVFITTKGGATVKLSGIEVKVYPRDYIEHAEPMIYSYRLAMLDYNLAALRSSIYATVDTEQAEFDTWAPWGWLAPAPLAVMTDADGKFELAGEFPERWALVATGRRAVFGKTEFYAWAVKDEEIKDRERVFLNNANLRP